MKLREEGFCSCKDYRHFIYRDSSVFGEKHLHNETGKRKTISL